MKEGGTVDSCYSAWADATVDTVDTDFNIEWILQLGNH